MAICVEQTGQVLQVAIAQVQPCPQYVLMTGQEFTSLPSLAEVFAMPLATDLQQMWLIGFSLPIILYLASWAFQTVIDFISQDHY